MRTTLIIDDSIMTRLREESVRQNKTISELVETALRLLLEPSTKNRKLPPLPSFDGGTLRVDVSNREALYQLMDDV